MHTRTTTTIAVALGVPLLAATLACGSSSSDSRGPGVGGDSAKPAAKEHTVVFSVGGTAGKAGSISYGMGPNMAQDNGTALPWTKEVKTTDVFLATSVSAQSGARSGTITCMITVDGQKVAENSSQGQYAVVSCTGSKTSF